MESEEAILENENNSNLESESGLRSRDVSCDASAVTDVSSSIDFSRFGNSDSAMEINAEDKVLPSTSFADKNGDTPEKTFICEKSIDFEHPVIAAKVSMESDIRKDGASTISQFDEVTFSTVPNSVIHRLPAHKEKHTNPIDYRVEEDDDVVILSHSENLLERQAANETEEMDTDGTSELSMQKSMAYEEVEIKINDSAQRESSKKLLASSDTSKCWEDDVDLLGEDSLESVNQENEFQINMTDNSNSASKNFQDKVSLGFSENKTGNVTSKTKPESFDISESEDMMVEEEGSSAKTMTEHLDAQPESQSSHAEKDIDDVEIVDEEWVAQVQKNNDSSIVSVNPQPQFHDAGVTENASDANQHTSIVVTSEIQISEANLHKQASSKVQSVEKMSIVLQNAENEVVDDVLSTDDILNISSADSSEAECISSEISKCTREKEVEISKQVSATVDTANNNDTQGERTMKASTVRERAPPPSMLSEVTSTPGSSAKANSGLPSGGTLPTDADLDLVEIIEEPSATSLEVNSHDSAKLRRPVQSEYGQLNTNVETNIATTAFVDATKHGNSNGSVHKTSDHHNAIVELDVAEIKTECNPCDINGSTDDLAMSENETASQGIKEEPNTDKADDAEDVVIVDDDGEVVPLKKEMLDSRTVMNGVDVQISGQTLHVSAEKNLGSPEPGNSKADSPKSKSSKQKLQTCIVCQKICRCKYNIVRNGDIKHLCDDACFKHFRKSPGMFLKQKGNPKAALPSAKNTVPDLPAISTLNVAPAVTGTTQESLYKTCSVCQLIDVNASQPFCNWKGLDFCGESCLGKFQANLNASCSFCHSYIPTETRTNFCLKIGNNMRPFCKNRCYLEFTKKLRLCSFCQRDVTSEPGAFTAIVGADKKFREFCSQACVKSMESLVNNVEVLSLEKGHLKQETIICSVCRKQAPIKYTVRLQNQLNKLCSELCLSAFQYTNKISMGRCDSCGVPYTAEEAQAHNIQYEGKVKRFCSDMCVNVFRKANSRVMPCGWCATKKLNFDMIERLDTENKFQLFCSLNCLSLYRVSLQAKSNQAVQCDQCRKVVPAQYHLTMSDASVRNFCTYTCVMTFQAQFEVQHVPPGSTPKTAPPPPSSATPGQFFPQGAPMQPHQQSQGPAPREASRGRMTTRQAAAREQSPSYPVISSVVSLAEHDVNPPVVQQTVPVAQQTDLPQVSYTAAAGVTHMDSMLASGDGKHQILIQAAPPKYAKNKSLQCRPVMQTKATSCRPHSQNKEVQTDEVPIQPVFIPVPVPVYIPMPTVMYTAPAPKIVPMPIPVPVPVFIPTTRKSVNGICKTIQDIVERIPADPLEAELLMMAEAVAAGKEPGDSDTDSEAEPGLTDIGESSHKDNDSSKAEGESESSTAGKKDGCEDEDMLQLALKMAEEMSGPIEDLETSVQPIAVKKEPPGQQPKPKKVIEPYYSQDEDDDNDDDYIPPQTYRGRTAKRSSRGRTLSSRPKRQRIDTSHEEDTMSQPETSSQPPPVEPPPPPPSDVNYRLKFTYGLNAWRHWVISKNMQIEKSKSQANARTRSFPTDILKCTVDELSMSLCLFVDEVRKPSGKEYSPDSVYYLCLGIQQYLYENGRIDSIFADPYFEMFTDRLNDILKGLQPKINKHGQMLCRIEEEHLWESKQLGAHSPFVLLNTLVYFHTKFFILKTVQEHMNLSFAQILKHWKKGVPLKGQSAASAKNVSLRFYCLGNGKKDPVPKKGKEGVPVYEVTENLENPLRCPVKLYEFFLSKCPETIKNRNDIFYPVPERSCVPDSPVWYSTKSIDTHTMEKMLTRILLVREIQEAHLHAQPIYL
ncbi:hypothetical protein BsWGS_12957 [Bradybaena similaris]